jgi:hypothetical protein
MLRPPTSEGVLRAKVREEPRLPAPHSGRGPPAKSHFVGRVRSAADAQPIAAAKIYYGDPSAFFLAGSTESDAAGRFEITADGTLVSMEIMVRAPGYVTRSCAIPAGEAASVLLVSGATIEGIVIDEAGAPVAGADVWCHTPGNTMAWPNSSKVAIAGVLGSGDRVVTDAQGHFVLRGLEEETEYVLRCSAPWRMEWLVAPGPMLPRAVAGTHDVRLRLTSAMQVSVELYDVATGKPPMQRGNFLVGWPTGWRSRMYRPPLAPALASGMVQARRAQSDEYRFEVQAVPSSEVPSTDQNTGAMDSDLQLSVQVTVPGYEPCSWRAALKPRTSNRIRVPLRAQAGTAEGEVRVHAAFAGGTPYSGPLLVAFRGVGQPLQYRMEFDSGEASGTLSLPVGTYRIDCFGLFAHGEWWRPASQPLDVRVSEGAPVLAALALTGNPVRVRVEDSSGRRMHGFDLSVGRPGPPHGWGHFIGGWDARVGAPEKGAIVWVPQGSALVRAYVEGVGLGEAVVSASGDGTPLGVEVVLDPNREIQPLDRSRLHR